MARYREKGKVVDAVQWFKHGDHPEVTKGDLHEFEDEGWLPEGHSGKLVSPGDYIVTYENGRVDVYSPDSFKKKFEPIK